VAHKIKCEHCALLRRSEFLLDRGPIVMKKQGVSSTTDKIDYALFAPNKDLVKKGAKLLEEKPFLIAPWCRTQLRDNEVKSLNHLAMRCMTCFGCKNLSFPYIV
jgi:SOS-response transcriptional repressor LexA